MIFISFQPSEKLRSDLWLNSKHEIARFSFPWLIDFHLNQNTRWIESVVLLHYKHFIWNGNFPPLETEENVIQRSVTDVIIHSWHSSIFSVSLVKFSMRRLSIISETLVNFTWQLHFPGVVNFHLSIFHLAGPGTQSLPCLLSSHKYHCSSLKLFLLLTQIQWNTGPEDHIMLM